MNRNPTSQVANKPIDPSKSPGGTSTAGGSGGGSTSSTTGNSTVATNESIKIIAESIGISNLSDEASRDLASDLTFIVKLIILDAQKFARKSRRKKIIPSDIDYSLKARSLEPIYGFQTMDQVPFRCATSTGGNGSGRSVFYVEEQVVDLIDLISTNNQTVKIPNDFVIHAHWLAIEGVQPSVPENPQLVTRDMQKKEAVEGHLAKPKEMLKQNLVKRNENLVKLKSLMPHDLSVEQQIYFKEVTEACVGSDEQKRTEALNSLSTDPGLHQLLPRLILFIVEGVRLNIIQLNMAILIYLMRMAKSLCENKSIYLEKYLHELMPSVLSCVLNKQLCARPEVDNHCALREFCARLVGQIVKNYSPTIPALQTKTVKVYLNSLQSDQATFATLFGAISGLSELGNEICESFIFPLVKTIGERITQILDSTASSQEKLPADKVKQQLIRCISTILKSRQTPNEFDYLTNEFGAYFGPQIHAQLMKLRNQQLTANQAQMAAAANAQSRTVITPLSNRTQGNVFASTNQPGSPCPATRINANTTTTTINSSSGSVTTKTIQVKAAVRNPNQIDSSMEASTPINAIHFDSMGSSTTNKIVNLVSSPVTTTQSINNCALTASNLASFNSSHNKGNESTAYDLKDNEEKLSDDLSLNDDEINVKNIPTPALNIHNPLSLSELKSSNADFEYMKSDTILVGDKAAATKTNDPSDLTFSESHNTSIHIEHNQHNLSNLTSDSNNTNNMTTSDVNLSDTIEPTNEPGLD